MHALQAYNILSSSIKSMVMDLWSVIDSSGYGYVLHVVLFPLGPIISYVYNYDLAASLVLVLHIFSGSRRSYHVLTLSLFRANIVKSLQWLLSGNYFHLSWAFVIMKLVIVSVNR